MAKQKQKVMVKRSKVIKYSARQEVVNSLNCTHPDKAHKIGFGTLSSVSLRAN